MLAKTPKQPNSRHSDGSTDTHTLFSHRKTFFQRMFINSFTTPEHASKCKIVHVAGTKGKGSTVEYIGSALIANGEKVGIFSSPHLHTARERIKINRSLISPGELVACGTEALDELEGRAQWTTVVFDQLLAAALLHFGRADVGYVVLETGIGGRFDSTNFHDAPAACVITSISLDHQNILGDTVEEIAWQKAGIIKAGCHVFTPSTQAPSVLEVFRRQAAELGATLHVVPVRRETVSPFLRMQGGEGQGQGSEKESTGASSARHIYDVEVENACLAAAVSTFLGAPVKGLADAFWPCRMEQFSLRGRAVVLDGAHNAHSVQTLLAGLRAEHGGRPIHVLFGAGTEKCVADMLEQCFLLADKVLLCQSGHFKSHTEQELAGLVPAELRAGDKLLNAGGLAASKYEPVSDGPWSTVGARLELLLRTDESGAEMGVDAGEAVDERSPVIAVCGSLFVASEGREALFGLAPALFSKADWVRQKDHYR